MAATEPNVEIVRLHTEFDAPLGFLSQRLGNGVADLLDVFRRQSIRLDSRGNEKGLWAPDRATLVTLITFALSVRDAGRGGHASTYRDADGGLQKATVGWGTVS